MRTPHDQADESVPGPKGQGSAELRELARALNGLFQELGCSLRSFADRVHRNPGAVSRYLRGGRMLPEDFIRVLLHEVGIARGGQVTSGEAERIAVLHRRALQRADGTSARIQLLHLDHVTSPESDYRRLPDPAALAFERHDPSLPLYQPPNLHSSRTRLLVIKQNVSILSRLQDDLRQAGPALSEVPTLIVDFDPAPCGISGLSRDGASVSRTRIDDLRAQLTDLLSRSQVIVFREHVTLGSSAREEGPGALSLWGSHPDFVIPTPRSHVG